MYVSIEARGPISSHIKHSIAASTLHGVCREITACTWRDGTIRDRRQEADGDKARKEVKKSGESRRILGIFANWCYSNGRSNRAFAGRHSYQIERRQPAYRLHQKTVAARHEAKMKSQQCRKCSYARNNPMPWHGMTCP